MTKLYYLLPFLFILSCGESVTQIDGSDLDEFNNSIEKMAESIKNDPNLTKNQIFEMTEPLARISLNVQTTWISNLGNLNEGTNDLTKSESEEYIKEAFQFYLEPIVGMNADDVKEFVSKNSDLKELFENRLIEYLKR